MTKIEDLSVFKKLVKSQNLILKVSKEVLWLKLGLSAF